MRINFISNLDLNEISGGWSGINFAIHRELSSRFETKYAGPINPPSDYPAKVVSKLKRVNGRPGAFHFFSARRLDRIAKLVGQMIDPTAECDFFHGSTPWIHFESPRPYFLYVDTCFSTYVDVYHNRHEFLSDDLERIRVREANWLEGASRVFFGTNWALKQAATDYQLSEKNLSVVGAGGSIAAPKKDCYQGGLNFLFVSLDFESKGGRLCARAFADVHQKYPNTRLHIVGQAPPAEILKMPGVSYEGFLSKSVSAELQKLLDLYASSFALVHPTSADIQPLVICEAAYFGCPSIAANNFGIPELVIDDATGFLVEIPLTAQAVAERMLRLCEDRGRYLAMRKAARNHAITNLTWSSVGERIVSEMKEALGPSVTLKTDQLISPSAFAQP